MNLAPESPACFRVTYYLKGYNLCSEHVTARDALEAASKVAQECAEEHPGRTLLVLEVVTCNPKRVV